MSAKNKALPVRGSAKVKIESLHAQVAEARARAEDGRRTAESAKVEFKRARKSFKLARKAAKELRKQWKRLKRERAKAALAASRAAAARKRRAAVVPVKKGIVTSPATQRTRLATGAAFQQIVASSGLGTTSAVSILNGESGPLNAVPTPVAAPPADGSSAG